MQVDQNQYQLYRPSMWRGAGLQGTLVFTSRTAKNKDNEAEQRPY